MSLARIQRDFLAAVNSDDSQLSGYLCQGGVLEPIDRINIYRNNTQQARVRALIDIYPITREILGEKFFNRLCGQFSQHHPATQWDLNQYGQDFPLFIVQNSATYNGLTELPYLEELGHLEWLLHQAYYAADSTTFPLKEFSRLDATSQGTCQLRLAPSLGLMKTHWPIYGLWQCWQRKELPEALPNISAPEYLCVSRNNYHPTVTLIRPKLFQLLSKLSGHTLAQLANTSELASALKVLPECIEKEWITGFRIPGGAHV